MAESNERVKFIRMGCGPSTSRGSRSGRCSRPSSSDLWQRLNSLLLLLWLCSLRFSVDWQGLKRATNVSLDLERFFFFFPEPLNLYIQTYNSRLYLPQRQERGANRCLRQLQKDRLRANISHRCVRCCGKRGAFFFLCLSVCRIQRRRCVRLCLFCS